MFESCHPDTTEGRPSGRPSSCAPSMGAILEVEVLPRAVHSERREAQLRGGNESWGGRVDRTCGSMNKKRMRGDTEEGEWARDHEALVDLNLGVVNAAIVQ